MGGTRDLSPPIFTKVVNRTCLLFCTIQVTVHHGSYRRKKNLRTKVDKTIHTTYVIYLISYTVHIIYNTNQYIKYHTKYTIHKYKYKIHPYITYLQYTDTIQYKSKTYSCFYFCSSVMPNNLIVFRRLNACFQQAECFDNDLSQKL